MSGQEIGENLLQRTAGAFVSKAANLKQTLSGLLPRTDMKRTCRLGSDWPNSCGLHPRFIYTGKQCRVTLELPDRDVPKSPSV